MQAATLSAYHPGELTSSAAKSYSLVNDTDQRLDVTNDSYDFVDNNNKVSYLTGSARCTLVTASAALAAATTNPTSTNIPTNTSNVHSLSARLGFGKVLNR